MPSGHTAGKPINQQGNCGLGTPRFAVVAGDEGVGVPLAAAIAIVSSRRQLPPSKPRVALPAPFPALTRGVGHVAAAIWTFNAALFRSNWLDAALFFASFVVGVLHAYICTVSGVPPILLPRRFRSKNASADDPSGFAHGVPHSAPIQSLSDVRRVDGASRDINRPAGVTFSLQISGNSIEPAIASRSRNLLSQHDSGPGGTDEAKHVGP